MPEAESSATPSAGASRPGSARKVVVAVTALAVALTAVVSLQRLEASRDAVTPPRPAARTASAPVHASARVMPGAADEAGAATAELLRRRGAALTSGQVAAWTATVDPAGRTASASAAHRFADEQRRVFGRIRSLRPADWSYHLLAVTPDLGSGVDDGSAATGRPWRARVELRYRLVEGGPLVRRQQYLTVVRRPGGWRVAGDTAGPTARDVWDLGPVTSAGASRCLVVGARGRSTLVRALAADCDVAASRVDGAWSGAWPQRTVVTVPGSIADLAVLLGRPSSGSGSATSRPASDATAGLDRTAAVTIGPATGPATDVLVNAEAFDRLSELGRRVVLTHELVHVATRAGGAGGGPTWLEEGYADHVAYGGTGLDPDQVAGEALAAVRRDGPPATLPSTEAFDAADPDAAVAYGQAWVAVQVLAARAGTPDRLAAFYRQAASAEVGRDDPGDTRALNAALAALGIDGESALVAAWQAELERLAG